AQLGGLNPAQALGGMASATSAGAGAAGEKGISSAAAIPVGDVRYDRENFPGGREAYRAYIGRALDVMGITDPAQRENWTRGYLTGAQRESGFNPLAVNDSDSNATSDSRRRSDGHPWNASRGGVQAIPGTFAAHHQPGTSTNIYDPVANICASMNYVMSRYGVSRSGANLASNVAQFNPNHGPQGY
ncbi:transglycosylase SLT domain-containing protein, partial [Mycobacteroides abscessus]